MMKQWPLILGLLFILLLTGCYQDEESIVNKDYIPDPPGVEVETHLTGTVKRLDGSVIESATVEAGSQMSTTGTNGYFNIGPVGMNRDGGMIRIYKSGYFPQRMSISSLAGQTHLLEPVLVPLGAIKTMSSQQPGEFQINNNFQVTIPRDGLIDPETGQLYQGDYLLSLEQLSSNDLERIYGPDHRPVIMDDSQKRRIITPSSGFQISVTSADGRELLLGGTASILIDLPRMATGEKFYSQTSNGDFVLLDTDKNGSGVMIKVEELNTILIGNDQSAIPVSGKVSIAESVPASFVTIIFQGSQSITTETSQDGQFRTWITADATSLEVVGPCGNVLISEEIPRGSEENIDIDIPLTYNDYLFFSGSVEKCSGELVKSGYLEIMEGKQSVKRIPISPDGLCSFFMMPCSQMSLSANVYEGGSSEMVFTTDLPSYGQWVGRKIDGCPQDPNTEAIIVVDGEQYYYSECKANLYRDDQEVTRIEFTVIGPARDEVHLFIRETKAGSDYWRSPSVITSESFRVINIPKGPEIENFEVSGSKYTIITWNNVSFQMPGGDVKKGEMQYTLERPR